MKLETRKVLEMFEDGRVHSSKDIAAIICAECDIESTIVYNCMTRLASKWGYLERAGLVPCDDKNRKAMTYRITQQGREVLHQENVKEYRGRGRANKNTIGRLITFDPESRYGEYYRYTPAPAIRVDARRDGIASSERI